MTPERLSRIRAVYEAAIEIEPAAREGFLARECQIDEDLRKDVGRLLDAREHLPDWLAGPLLSAAPPVLEAIAKPVMVGRRLRGYEIIRDIGHGGMGSVYLAERVDGVYRKQVAIKVVQAGTNNDEILGRFQREREILASLDHPNIARLIDGGSTEQGLPYFVMEFVEGQPIHLWCDQRKLNVSQRVQLFRQVCDAVGYAHQHLVVHRDLKPSNILVTTEGTVKLLDFGIAKLLSEQRSEELAATITLSLVMTPEYASPEQVTGKVITTLTDIYSLGMILYELLTGHRPYHVRRAAIQEIARVISEQEPARPSQVIATTYQGADSEKRTVTPESVSEVREGEPARLRKRLEGDLDSILMTALRKEPTRRYSSVETFSDDLRRHLENRPVSAHQDSSWYRVSRLARRHPGGVGAAIVIVLSLLAGIGTSLWGTRVALEAAQHRLPGDVIAAPQIALWLYCTLALFTGAVYLTRALAVRVAGALSGATLMAIVGFLTLKLDYSMGWWRSRFPEDANPFSLFSKPVMFLVVLFGSAAFLLVSWRISRRFGWAGTASLIALSALLAIRERLWWDQFLHLMTVSWSFSALATDAALLALGFALGYSVMRLVAGPAHNDRLAHKAWPS